MTKVEIVFQAEVLNMALLKEEIEQALKPLLDSHHTRADVIIRQDDFKFHIEGLWNG